MFDFYKKRRLKKFIHSKPFLGGIGVLVGLMFFATFNAYKKEQNAKEQQKEISAALSLLEERKAKLENDIEKLDTKRGIEEELRNRYELGKEGEEALVFVEEEKKEEKQIKKEEEMGFWKKLFDF